MVGSEMNDIMPTDAICTKPHGTFSDCIVKMRCARSISFQSLESESSSVS